MTLRLLILALMTGGIAAPFVLGAQTGIRVGSALLAIAAFAAFLSVLIRKRREPKWEEPPF